MAIIKPPTGPVYHFTWLSFVPDSKERKFLARSLHDFSFSQLLIIGFIVAGLQMVHASALLLDQNIWWYMLGVAWLLVTIGYVFRIFLRSTLAVGE